MMGEGKVSFPSEKMLEIGSYFRSPSDDVRMKRAVIIGSNCILGSDESKQEFVVFRDGDDGQIVTIENRQFFPLALAAGIITYKKEQNNG